MQNNWQATYFAYNSETIMVISNIDSYYKYYLPSEGDKEWFFTLLSAGFN